MKSAQPRPASPAPRDQWQAVVGAVRPRGAGCPSSKLSPREFVGGFERKAIACVHGEADKWSATGRPKRTPNPHRAGVGSDRAAPSNCGAGAQPNSAPCFRRVGRLLWILLSRWWSGWRESLVVVQPETVLRWRRNGWSALWRYRSSGRWRGGRPRVSSEVRHLITRIARENFLWGAPRIHGELLMLGFSVSQATVSRYLPAPSRRPTQSWRTFLRNQASAFGQYSEERSRVYAGLHGQSYWAKLMGSTAAQVAAVGVGLWRGLGRQQPTLKARRISLRSAQCDRAAMHRVHRLAAV